MRALRFVTLGDGGDRLVLEAADGTERFVLTVDAALREALGAEQRRPAPARHAVAEAEGAAPLAVRPLGVTPDPSPDPAVSRLAGTRPPAAIGLPPAPSVTPREIQVRVRAGESPEALAAEYGMSLERVMRFAAAVMDERRRIADEARRARARRSGADGGPLVVFGEAVDDRFRAHGIDAEAVRWDTRRRDDGEWLVVAEWLGGESTHTAEWQFSRSTRTVVPLDAAAGDLLSDRPIRPVLPPERPRPSLSIAPPLVPGIVAFPPMPDAETGPMPRVDDVFDQEAEPAGPAGAAVLSTPSPVPSVPVAPAVPSAPPAPMAAEAGPDYEAPPLPLGIAEPTPPAAGHGSIRNLGVRRRDETDEERAARARIPSWDDILLGVKRRD